MPYKLRFDGTNDRVSVPIPLNFTDVTFEWTGSFDVLSGSDRGLFQSWRSVSAEPRFICWWDEPNGLTLIFNGSAGNHTLTATTALQVGTEYKIAVRVRNSNSIDLLVDDVLEDSVTLTSGYSTKPSSLPLFISDEPTGAGGLDRPFDGDLTLFRVIGNSGNAATLDPTASSGTGSTLPDTVGAYDGTLVNFPTDDSQWILYGAGDTTAPAFTVVPAVTATTQAGHTIAATLDEAGTLYGVRLPSGAGAPNSAQVKAGQDSTGSAAPEAKSSAAANSASLVFSTGSASTAYDYYIVAEDDEATPNLQASPTLVSDTTQASLAITAADDITNETGTATFTLSGNTNPPTAARLNGTTLTGLTDLGSGVWQYNKPLIADDATATLAVDVDSTTITTAISYANSYPYELVTHGEPDANSIFFDTAFATNGPVEWGVVTDYDSAIVTVDHAAMDTSEDELNDVDLHATEVASGSSTATYKYFVPESGATGTFQSTITVSESVSAPGFAPNIGLITKGETTASIPFTYVGGDADSFEYSSDGGSTWSAAVSPISLSGLTASTFYSGLVRAVNAGGTGPTASYSFTTNAVGVVDNWPYPPDTASIVISWEWGKRHPMTQSRVRMFKGNS